MGHQLNAIVLGPPGHHNHGMFTHQVLAVRSVEDEGQEVASGVRSWVLWENSTVEVIIHRKMMI